MTDFPIDWRNVVEEAIRRRKRDGLAQRSLAALAGVSLPTGNAFEQGEISVRFEKIVAILGALGLFVHPKRSDSLQSLIYAARARWQELVAELPDTSASRHPQGFSEHAYAVDGIHKVPTLSKLRELLASAPKTVGWPPFWMPTKASMKPRIRAGHNEC